MSNLEKEITKLYNSNEKLIKDYIELPQKTEVGRADYALYSDYLIFSNYQINSIKSVIKLTEEDKYKDAFTVLRSVFEAYFLFSLMVQGKKYSLFFPKPKGQNIDQAIEKVNKDIEADHKKGNKLRLKAKRPWLGGNNSLIEIVYEGPYINNKRGTSRLVPWYYRIYNEFQPTDAFLDTRGYLAHLPAIPKYTKKALQNKENQKKLYKYFLRFDSILYYLKLNNLSTDYIEKRIKVHYNFLSQFAHSMNSGLDTVEGNKRKPSPYINSIEELNQEDKNIKLLSFLYAGYMIAMYSELVMSFYEEASKYFIKSTDFNDSKDLIHKFYKEYNYFWFIYNSPHRYDKLKYCYASFSRTGTTKKIEDMKDSKVPMDKDVLNRLKGLQSEWGHQTCGVYKPPF